VSVLSNQSETASLPHLQPYKNIIGFRDLHEFLEVVLGSLGEQLLHLLRTGYATDIKNRILGALRPGQEPVRGRDRQTYTPAVAACHTQTDSPLDTLVVVACL